MSDVKVQVYQTIGELSIRSANFQRKSQKVKVDFFYSSVYYQSRKAKEDLDAIIHEAGADYFGRVDHDLLDSKERKVAERTNVTGVPALVLNDKQVLANPSKAEMSARINEYSGPAVNALDSKLELEVTVPPIQKPIEGLLHR